MKRIAFAGLLLAAAAAPSAWADCHLPKLQSLSAETADELMPPCLAPLKKFLTLPHSGAGAAGNVAALWADTKQAELQDPLGVIHRGRDGIRAAFEGKVFTSLLAGKYRVTDGSISQGHLSLGGSKDVDEAGILEWDAQIDGAPGGGRHHVRALVVKVGDRNWAFHSVHVTADLTSERK
jgi:hypothetical protein